MSWLEAAVNSTSLDLLELDELITVVARFHAFTEADIQDAWTIALGDMQAALICFRALAKRTGAVIGYRGSQSAANPQASAQDLATAGASMEMPELSVEIWKAFIGFGV